VTVETPLHGAGRVTTHGELAGRFAHGVAWSGIAKTVSQSLAWVATLLVARYLSPSDYGLFGLAMLYLGLLQLIADLGIGTAVLANRHRSDEDLPQIHGLAVLSGLVGTLLVVVTSPLIGMFFNAEQLPLLLVALSPTFLISSLKTVPQTLLQREFHFKWLAFVDAGQALALSGMSIALAMAGFGYWTLALAAIASATINTSIVLWRQRVPIEWPDFHKLGSLLAFSTQVILQRIAWYASSNADFATAGKLLGKAAAGSYMLAWHFANAPLERVASLILQVSPSVLGAACDDKDELRRHVLRATEMIALVIFPMCIGMALVARPLVLLFLGTKWESAIVPLQLLASYTAVRSLIPLLGQVLLVIHEEHYATRVMFMNLALMSVAFVIGAKVAGIVGIAAAYMIAHPFVATAFATRALRGVGSSLRECFTKAVLPPLICSVVMTLTVLASAMLSRNNSLAVQLAAEVGAGVLSYTAAALLLYRERLGQMVSAFRATRKAIA